MLFLRTSDPGVSDGARSCEACGAAMAAGQDWCLECGTAAPGRLGQRPGMRAAATVAALTLALVGGAVAASYAALSEDARVEASRPAPPSAAPIAGTPPPAATVPPATVPPATTVPPTTTTPTIPQTTTPTLPPSSGITTPRATTTPPTTTIRPSNPTTTTPTRTTPTETTPKKPELTAITPGADFAQLYDPYGRAVDKTDPADAHDGDTKSSFSVTTAGKEKEMGVGVALDLEDPQGVKVVELVTKTPGFRVEVYASDEELPPDILDTRWAHLVDRSDVDEKGTRDKNVAKDGKERIVLGGGSHKYRYVLLWFTTPPDAGPTVRLSELTLYR